MKVITNLTKSELRRAAALLNVEINDKFEKLINVESVELDNEIMNTKEAKDYKFAISVLVICKLAEQ